MRQTADVIDLVASAQAGDRKALDALIERYEPYVQHQVRRVAAKWGIEHEDAEQEARIRLVDALLSFDVTRESARPVLALQAYLSAAARRAALRAVSVRECVRLPSNIAVDVAKVADVTRRLAARGDRTSDEVVAARLGWTAARVAKVRVVIRGSVSTSLNAPILGGDNDDGSDTWIDRLPANGPSPEESLDAAMLRRRIDKLLDRTLTPAEAEAIRATTLRDLPLADFAAAVGVTRQAIALRVQRAMKKLKAALEAEGVMVGSALLQS